MPARTVPPPARPRSRGFTLIEMLTAIALIAILSALAVPGFNRLRHDASRTAAVNDFFHALFLARSEAIKRGMTVSVCQSADHETCSDDAEWTTGWIVFVNTDRDRPPQHDPGESILAVHDGWTGGRITSNRDAYSFRPFMQGVINGTIVFCDPRGAGHARAIIVSHTGRPRVARRTADNRPLPCPPG